MESDKKNYNIIFQCYLDVRKYIKMKMYKRWAYVHPFLLYYTVYIMWNDKLF